MVSRISKALPQQVSVWRPHDREWKAAIQAQVLQTGTGERKGGVKTGAADHLVFACVQEQFENRGTAEAVVLASADQKLLDTCRVSLGQEILFAKSNHELLGRLIEFEPAPEELAEAVEEELKGLIINESSDLGGTLASFAMGFEIVGRASDVLENNQRELARLGRIEIVELQDLHVGEFLNGARVGYAQVRLFADVHMTLLELTRQDHGRHLEWVQKFSGTVSGGMIDVALDVSFDRDWNLSSVAPAGAAQINFNLLDEDDE